MRRLLIGAALLLVPALAEAQGTYELRIFVGTTTQSQSVTTLTGFTCGVPKVTTPPPPVVNPIGVAWDDPTDPTRDCVWNDPGSGPLRGPNLPIGSYESTIVRIVNGVASEEGPRVPFRRAPPPVTGLRFVKP